MNSFLTVPPPNPLPSPPNSFHLLRLASTPAILVRVVLWCGVRIMVYWWGLKAGTITREESTWEYQSWVPLTSWTERWERDEQGQLYYDVLFIERSGRKKYMKPRSSVLKKILWVRWREEKRVEMIYCEMKREGDLMMILSEWVGEEVTELACYQWPPVSDLKPLQLRAPFYCLYCLYISS